MSAAAPRTSSWWMDRITADPSVSKLLELVAEGETLEAALQDRVVDGLVEVFIRYQTLKAAWKSCAVQCLFRKTWPSRFLCNEKPFWMQRTHKQPMQA